MESHQADEHVAVRRHLTAQSIEAGILTLKPLIEAGVLTLKPLIDTSILTLKPLTDTSILTLKPLINTSILGLKPLTDTSILTLKPLINTSILGLEPLTDTSILTLKPLTDTSILTLKPLIDTVEPRVNAVQALLEHPEITQKDTGGGYHHPRGDPIDDHLHTSTSMYALPASGEGPIKLPIYPHHRGNRR